MKLNIKILLILLLDLIFSVFAVYNIFQIKEKPIIPFFSSLKSMGLVENTTFFNKEDTLLNINSIKVYNNEEIEFICDTKNVGDTVRIDVKRGNVVITKNLRLVNYYSDTYLIIIFFVGLSFFLTGIFVLIKNPHLTFSYIFHWLTLSASGMIFLTWGRIQLDNLHISLIIRTLFDISLLLTPITFLHFSLIFPKRKFQNILNNYKYIYLIAFIFCIVLFIFDLRIFSSLNNTNSIEIFRIYNFLHTDCAKGLMIYSMILVIINYIHSYFITTEEDVKRKLKWIFLGIISSPFVYAFLYSLPRILYGKPWISEELMLIILIIAPITFQIAIFRYRLIDINFLVSKGMLYSLIVILFSLIYVAIIALAANTVEPFLNNTDFLGVNIIYVLISIFAIFIFQPLKNKLQQYIDKKFYRVRYNYKVVLSNFLNKIKEFHDESQIVELIAQSINKAIPISSYSILWRNDHVHVLFSEKFDFNVLNLEQIISFIKSSGCHSIYSSSSSVEEGLKFSQIDIDLKNEGIELLLNSYSEDDKPKLTLLFGKKKAGNKFSLEDVELLETITHTSSVAIYKVKLQKDLIIQQAEKEKLKDLNDIKSFFVSSVSHELKTPLTAIKLYAEFLNSNPNLSEVKKNEYLSIIEGECDRLDRLVNNVLSFSKIEKGTKSYNFVYIDVKNLLDYIINTFNYQLSMQDFKLFFDYEATANYTIEADEDALKEVFINIISNSIKYSFIEKEIKIALKTEPNYAVITFSDKGIGIGEKDVENIFTPFYRSLEKNVSNLGGAGLGLAIVKNIIDAHSGTINVESQIGKGTTFIIKLPIKYEK